jgi:DNA helicase-2/ATP-dependent DNA helicase PcrA
VRADELLADLDPSQRAAVIEPAVPLAILAPAGSGKTRALTRRIAWQSAEGNIDPNHVPVTFTRKAAGELRGRLSRLGVRGSVTAGTFHAVALAQLRRRHQDLGTTMPGLLDRKARLLGPLIGGKRGADLAVAINEIASEVEWAKARRVPPGGYEQQVLATRRETPRPREVASRQRRAARKRALDFDDLIDACTEAPRQTRSSRYSGGGSGTSSLTSSGCDARSSTRCGLARDRADVWRPGDPDQRRRVRRSRRGP